MFDSPFECCSVCHGYVLLDQTQGECAREHGCRDASVCPLRRMFTGFDFASARIGAERALLPTPRAGSAPLRPSGRRGKDR
jgi:hypothetical protein